MNALLLDLSDDPTGRGERIHAQLREALSRLRISLTYERGATERLQAFTRQAAWQEAGIILLLADAENRAAVQLSPESRSRKAMLRMNACARRSAYVPDLAEPPPLAEAYFPLGQLDLPAEFALATPTLEAFRIAMRKATIWVGCKRQRDESLALAEIYAAAPLAATAF